MNCKEKLQWTCLREQNANAIISAGVLFCMAYECVFPVSEQIGLP